MATANFPTNVTFSYAYDPLSRRVSMSDTLGGTTAYAYDAEDRLLSLTTPWGAPITQSYDSAGRPLRLAYPNGLDADVSFEPGTGRLVSILHRPGTLGAPIAQFLHTYDARGDLSTLSELTGTKSFVYDKIERLTGATQTLPAPATQIETYAYDTEGNRTASLLSPSYSTDAANHVLADTNNTYSWSLDSDLISRTPKESGVTYNFVSRFIVATNQMRLESATGNDGTVINFYYDSFGRLLSQQGSAGNTSAYYYDGPDTVLRLQPAAGGATQWTRFVHGPEDDQPLALERYPVNAPPTPGTGSQFYYHADGEGSVRLLSDANAQIANRYDYDSYGQRLTAVESVEQPYGWKAREWIAGPNLYYNRARFYDPVLGRFISQDPLAYDAGDWNFYSFAWNNPKNWNDPSGLSAAVEEAGVDAATTSAILAGGTVAVARGTILSGEQASQVLASTGSAVQKIGAEVACKFFQIAAAFDYALSAPSGSLPVLTGCGILVVPTTTTPNVTISKKSDDNDDCDKEWEEAFRICTDLIRTGQNFNKRLFGPNPYDLRRCAKGYVSKRCGGNPVTMSRGGSRRSTGKGKTGRSGS